MLDQNPLVIAGPEHAELVAAAGWSRRDLQQGIWEQARIPLSAWPAGCGEMETFLGKIGPVTPESMIPIALKPEQLLIVIGGGAGKHSHYFPPFPGCFPISKLVTK